MDSDIDVLVSFAPDRCITGFEFIALADALEQVFGKPVDLLTRESVEHDPNPMRRQAMLGEVRVLYHA